MAAQWYVTLEGKRFGPMSAKQLKQLANSGRMSPDDLVSKDGIQKVVPARKVKGLFEPPAPAHEAPPPDDPLAVLSPPPDIQLDTQLTPPATATARSDIPSVQITPRKPPNTRLWATLAVGAVVIEAVLLIVSVFSSDSSPGVASAQRSEAIINESLYRYRSPRLVPTNPTQDVAVHIRLKGVSPAEFNSVPSSEVYLIVNGERRDPQFVTVSQIDGFGIHLSAIAISAIVPRNQTKMNLHLGSKDPIEFEASRTIRSSVKHEAEPSILSLSWAVYWPLLAATFFGLASMWLIYTKAMQPGWAAIVPIYNIYIAVRVARRPVWWVIPLFIPFVNIVMHVLLSISIARAFGKQTGFTVGLILLPFIFYPILGFGNASYKSA